MIEVILIISLSVIFVILLRRLPDVKLNSSFQNHSLINESPQVIFNFKPISNDEILKLWEKADKEFNAKNFNKAEKLYLKIASIEPRNPKVYGRLGIIYLEKKNYLDAKEAFSEAAKREPQNPLWHNNLGLALYNLKRFEESIEAYKKSVEIDSTKAVRFFNLGLAYEAIGEYQKALNAYEEAANLEPDNLKFRSIVDRIKQEIKKK